MSIRVVLLNELLPATRRSQRPQWDAVALIVERGVDVGGKDFNGETLLKRAMEEGAWDVVKLAIERTGCRWRARSERDDDDRSVLFLATMRGRGDNLALLLDRGATLSARDIDAADAGGGVYRRGGHSRW